MKQSVGLSLTLGLSLALGIACGKKNSNKSTDPAPVPAPTLTTTHVDKPSTPTGSNPTNQPTTPLIPNAPVVDTPGPDAGTITNPPVVTQPTAPVDSALRGIWGVSLAQKPRSCSSIYDFRTDASLSIHLLCPGDGGKSIALQTESYSLISDDGAVASYTRTASSCGAITQAKTLTFSYKVNAREQRKYLQLTENRRPSPELLNIPKSSLAGDLRVASTLYGRPVKRGCFTAGVLSRFEVKGANR